MSKFTVGQPVTVEHRRSGRIIPGVVSEVLADASPEGVRPVIVGGQPQYRVDIGGANMQCGEDQLRAL
jgi:hypothetical protein